MKSLVLLTVLVAVIVSPVSLQCIQGNCSDSASMFSFNIASIFPFFGPVDFESERDKEPLGDFQGIPGNDSEKSAPDVILVRMETISFIEPDLSEDQSSNDTSISDPLTQFLFDKLLSNIGVLDLSGKTMTGKELYNKLKVRREQGRPVTTLILSNCRITPLDSGAFAIAEGTIQTLIMDNTTANVDAFRGLTNLKVMNLSNNGLSSFAWYGLMKDTLEVLDLSHNNFEEIRPELSMLRSLRQLYMSHNKIMSVAAFPLNMLPNLEVLDLSMNVLTSADFSELENLQQLNVDWNFLWRAGKELRLPSQRLSVKLASNPWRCDCGLLEARDNNEVLDIDQLQCATHQSFGICNGCPRLFLPTADAPDRQVVSNLTKRAIEHFDCFDIPELYYSLSNAYVKLRDNEPEKLVGDIIFLTIAFILIIVAVVLLSKKLCCKKNTNRKFWLRVKQIPQLSFEKMGKPQEVPYIKIEEPFMKA